ncbi:MAG: AgmX/PglI C-terminal domain-containing protein [Kofleriaceae bacterium]|nr:AgmX/PglI C-terminal domain-containing protein [Kofleriaceae bacterium]
MLAGQLVEERVFSGPVSLGQSLHCALSVPVEGIPREHLLVSRDEGRFVLHVPRGMTGRVGADDAFVDVAAGQAVTLEHGARGKLVAGEATLLIQEIATPPAVPRPQLPASIRGTLADRIDRRLAGIIGGSLVVHIALAAYAWTGDVDERPLGAPPVAMYQEDVIDVQLPDLSEPPPVADPSPSQQPGVATPAAPQHQTPRPIVSRPSAPGPTQAVDSQRLANILTGGDSESGLGGMRSRQPGADLGKQIDEARNKQITIGDGGHTSRVDDRARPGTVDDRPIADNPQLVTHEEPRPEETRGRIIPGDVRPDDTTTLTPAIVLERINTLYMAGLKRCYRLGLAEDSTLGGRVKINFTVDERGKVIDPDASGVSSQVDGCVSKAMSGWRFPIPRKNGEPSETTFTVSLALQPS